MVDYKEITRKKDRRTFVFCSIEDLLKDYYNVPKFEDTFPFQTKPGEWIIHCPFCKAEGHKKHKLYIKNEPDKGGLIGYCFVCTRTYVNIDDKVDTSFKAPTKYGFNFKGKFEIAPLTDPIWDLDKYENDFTDYDEDGMKYLINRHGFMKDLYKPLGIKFWNENPVIPFYDLDDKVFYYQIRFAHANGKIKYYLPKVVQKPVYMIKREGQPRHRIVIVEGIFDAIAALIQCPDYTPIAVLGSSISDYQIEYIRAYAGEIWEIRIWMDETDISKRIANKIKSVIDYVPIGIIKSYGPDPEEVMNWRMRHGKQLQWIKSFDKMQNHDGFGFHPLLNQGWLNKINCL